MPRTPHYWKLRIGNWTLTTLLLVLTPIARAESWSSTPLSSLTTSAEAIVIAIPKDNSWKVEKVLLGNAIKIDDAITPHVLCPLPLEIPIDPIRGPNPKTQPVQRALVFLSYERSTDKKLRPIDSGVRLLTADHRVYRPLQLSNPGGYTFLPIIDTTWDDTLKIVTTLAADAPKIRQLKDLPDPATRNQALLKWLTDHQAELHGGNPLRDPSEPVDDAASSRPKNAPRKTRSWGEIPYEFFSTLTASDRFDDVLQTARLWRQINPDRDYRLPGIFKSPAFQSAAAREKLLAIATDPKAKTEDRHIALALPQCAFQFADTLSHLIDFDSQRRDYSLRMLSLVDDPDSYIRLAAVTHITNAFNYPGSKPDLSRVPLLLETFVARYKIETPGPTQLTLARAIIHVGGPEPWQKLTGNPNGVLGELSCMVFDPKNRTAILNFRLEGPTNSLLFTAPTLNAERLSAGKVTATHSLTPAFPEPSPFTAGWGPRNNLHPTVDLSSLPPGQYRLRLQGTLGAKPSNTQPFTSEPILITIE